MSKNVYIVLNWAFIVYEAVVFISIVIMMLIQGRSVPAEIKIEDETPAERGKVLIFLGGFLALLVVVFFVGS